jgi:hypothetical protein
MKNLRHWKNEPLLIELINESTVTSVATVRVSSGF